MCSGGASLLRVHGVVPWGENWLWGRTTDLFVRLKMGYPPEFKRCNWKSPTNGTSFIDYTWFSLASWITGGYTPKPPNGNFDNMMISHERTWWPTVQHFEYPILSQKKMGCLSQYIKPCHFHGDKGWFSDWIFGSTCFWDSPYIKIVGCRHKYHDTPIHRYTQMAYVFFYVALIQISPKRCYGSPQNCVDL